MKNRTLSSIIIFLSLILCNCGNSSDQKKTESMIKSKESVLRHVVLFKFKEDATEAQIKEIEDKFMALPKSIPVILDFEWGINDSPEDFHQGFTHCYLLSFKSENDRDKVYTVHSEHKAFVSSLQPYLEKVFVVDYWTK